MKKFYEFLCAIGNPLVIEFIENWNKKKERRKKEKREKNQRIVILICEYWALISWFALIGLVLNELTYNSGNHDILEAYESTAFYPGYIHWLYVGICCDFVFRNSPVILLRVEWK